MKARYQNRFMRLIHHQDGVGTPEIAINPFAGHRRIAGGTGRSSIIKTLCFTGSPVWEIEPLGCHPDDYHRGYEWPVKNIKLAMDIAAPDGQANLWGMCQGGPPALFTAAWYPHEVGKLVLIASPNNTEPEGSILDPVIRPPWTVHAYESALEMIRFVHPWAEGNMPCSLVVKMWRGHKEEYHAAEEKKPENFGFYEWYNHPAGSWKDYDDGKGVIGRGLYIGQGGIIDNFLNNNIARNRVTMGGQRVPIHKIKCPVYVLMSQKDEVCPWDWGKVPVPHAEYLEVYGNHMGTMIGSASQKTILNVATA